MGWRILLLTPDLPYPPQQGGAIRAYHLLRALAREHTVDLLSFAPPGAHPGPLLDLCRCVETVSMPRRSALRRLLHLLGPQPDLAGRLPSPTFTARLAELLATGDHDWVQIEGLEMAAQALRVPARPPLIYDALNVEYRLQERLSQVEPRRPPHWPAALYSRLQAHRLRTYEGRLLQHCARALACSSQDAQALRELCPQVPVTVVPNGVDVSHFRPQGGPVEPDSLVFTATMSYRPNAEACLWFCSRVLPRLQALRPGVHLTIVGRSPPPAIRRLASRPGVRVTGWVEDVRPFLERSEVYVAPLRAGSGTRLKILEAMAMAKPVVTTPIGAEGLDLRPGQELLIVEGAGAMVSLLHGLLADRGRQREIGRRARQVVEERYAWEVVTRPLLRAYGPSGAA